MLWHNDIASTQFNEMCLSVSWNWHMIHLRLGFPLNRKDHVSITTVAKVHLVPPTALVCSSVPEYDTIPCNLLYMSWMGWNWKDIVPRVGLEPTSLTLQASVLPLHHIGSMMSPLYQCPPVYAAPCLRDQCRLLHMHFDLAQTAIWIWHEQRWAIASQSGESNTEQYHHSSEAYSPLDEHVYFLG